MDQQHSQNGESDGIAPMTYREAAAPISPPTKRQKRTASSPGPSMTLPPRTQFSRKGKACIACRKLKVKCDSAERGMVDCSRCLRRGVKCLSERQVWASADEISQAQVQLQHQQRTDLVIIKLERALEDVLEKLSMPALELYAPQAIVEQAAEEPPRSTRRNSNSEEPSSMSNGPRMETGGGLGLIERVDRDLSPGPMRSLIEATRLDGLWSQLRSKKQRRKGGMRRMDSDLISESIITYQQAEGMFQFFMGSLSPYLFSGSIPLDATLESVRTSSTVLFTAIILVSALHVPRNERIYEACHSRFLGLVSSALFDRFHTLDDIRGLCIAALWLPDLSWKLSGICIRMATELNLHHAFYEAFCIPETEEQGHKESLEKARLWYLLFVLDHQSSIAYGRPPVMAELRPIKDYDLLLRSPSCTPDDQALIAQVTACVRLSKAFETFGLEPKRTMGDDDASVLLHLHLSDEARLWRQRWEQVLDEKEENSGEHQEEQQQQAAIGGHEVLGLHYHFGELVLHSVVLRGRSLENLAALPSRLRPLTLKAIEAAHKVLEHFVEEGSALRNSLVGMPLYLHSMIAFAVVFVMKLQHRWHLIGITIDPTQVTFPLIQTIVSLLRVCKAGSEHIIFSMANGFERMLKQASRQRRYHQAPPAQPHNTGATNAVAVGETLSDWQQSQGRVSGSIRGQNIFVGDSLGAGQEPIASDYYPVLNNGANGSPQTDQTANPMQPVTPGISPFENWDFQDQEFWNFGMGYDLLASGVDGSLGPGYPDMFD